MRPTITNNGTHAQLVSTRNSFDLKLGDDDLIWKMQGYVYFDVRTKGPHINIKRDNGNPTDVVTEAKLAPTFGELEWIRCCDRPMSKKMVKSADSFIRGLYQDVSLWEAAKDQIEETIARFEVDKKSGSKGDKDIATRNLLKWESMLKKVNKILDK